MGLVRRHTGSRRVLRRCKPDMQPADGGSNSMCFVQRTGLARFQKIEQARKKASDLHARAGRCMALGKYSAAEVAFRAGMRPANTAKSHDPQLLVALLNDLAVLYKYTNRLAAAQRAYQRALRILNASEHPDANSIATLYHNLAGAAFAKRRYRVALRQARLGIKIRKAARPVDVVALACDEAAFAAILAETGDGTSALNILSHALRVFRGKLGPRHYEVGAALANMGVLQWKAGRANLARRTLSRSISILNRALGRGHPRTAIAIRNIEAIKAHAHHRTNIS